MPVYDDDDDDDDDSVVYEFDLSFSSYMSAVVLINGSFSKISSGHVSFLSYVTSQRLLFER